MFHISLLEHNTTRKEWIEKIPELDAGDNSNKYKVEAIWDSAVYANKSESGHLPDLYYLVAWKGYPKKENPCKLLSAVQHLKKLISSFYKSYLEKPTTTSSPINSALLMAKPTIKPTQPITKRKQGQSANSTNKQAKKNWNSLRDKQPPFWLVGIFFFLQTLT